MTTASPVRIPAPTRDADADVEAATRFALSVVLDDIEFIYDYNGTDEVIYLRVMKAGSHGTLPYRLESRDGTWLASCDTDALQLNPDSTQIDFDSVEYHTGAPLTTVVPLAQEAIALFYDSDELTTLHRRALRAFYRGLAAADLSA